MSTALKYKKQIIKYLGIMVIAEILNMLGANYFFDKWYGVSLIMRFVIAVLIISYTCGVCDTFCNGEYIFLKSLGESERNIEKNMFNNKLDMIVLFIASEIVFAKDSNVLTHTIIIVNAMIFAINCTLVMYRSRYKKDIFGKTCVIVGCVMAIAIIYQFFITILYCSSLNGFLLKFYENRTIKLIENIAFTNPYMIMANLFVIAVMYITSVNYDDEIEDMFKLSYFIKKKSSGKSNRLKNSFIGRNLIPPLSKFRSLIPVLFFYVIYVFLGLKLYMYRKAFYLLTMMFVFFISSFAEYIFREDADNRRWYRLLGERYNTFIKKKFISDAIIVFPAVIFFFVICICCGYIDAMTALVILYATLVSAGWTMFYSCRYFYMEKHQYDREVTLYTVVALLVINPLTCVILCIYNYIKGRQEWSRYVGN